MTTREEFEAWCYERIKSGRGYDMWDVWQAASASPQQKVQVLSEIGKEFTEALLTAEMRLGWGDRQAFFAAGWQASRAAALEEAAKECEKAQEMYERRAEEGRIKEYQANNAYMADAAEQCAVGIRALKESK